MGKVTWNAAQVPQNPTFNWSFIDPTIGTLDIGVVSTDAPGPGPIGSPGGVNNVTTSVLPRPIFQPQLGQVARAWEPQLGAGEFIYLACPTSTAIPLGTLVTYADSGALANTTTGTNIFGTSALLYSAVVVPANTANAGLPVAVCVASTVANSGLGVTSNTTQVQYAWFQTGGVVPVLKTNAQIAPSAAATNAAGIYISGTNGRIYVTASAGKQVLGARLGNTYTTTTTASAVLVMLNGRPVLEGK